MEIPCDAIQNNMCGIYLIRNLKNNKNGLSRVSTIPEAEMRGSRNAINEMRLCFRKRSI